MNCVAGCGATEPAEVELDRTGGASRFERFVMARESELGSRIEGIELGLRSGLSQLPVIVMASQSESEIRTDASWVSEPSWTRVMPLRSEPGMGTEAGMASEPRS